MQKLNFVYVLRYINMDVVSMIDVQQLAVMIKAQCLLHFRITRKCERNTPVAGSILFRITNCFLPSFFELQTDGHTHKDR